MDKKDCEQLSQAIDDFNKENPTMDIHSPRGTKVRFAYPNAGWIGDQSIAQKRLALGATYTVLKTDVHSFSTTVYLEEFPGVPFNSVMFEPVEEANKSN